MTHTVINLPYEKPPLNANTRLHWAREAKIRKKIRHDTAWRIKAASKNIPPLAGDQRIKVWVEYTPATKRTRDTDNLAPFLKPIYDAVVDAGLCPDDNPHYMLKPETIIHPAEKRHRHRIQLHLEIIDTTE